MARVRCTRASRRHRCARSAPDLDGRNRPRGALEAAVVATTAADAGSTARFALARVRARHPAHGKIDWPRLVRVACVTTDDSLFDIRRPARFRMEEALSSQLFAQTCRRFPVD